MEIIRIKAIEELNSLRMEGISKIYENSLPNKVGSEKFAWSNFINYWEFALQFPWNALWLAVDEVDEDMVYGFIGGSVTPSTIAEDRLAYKVCSGILKTPEGEKVGWELFFAFLEWAIKDQNVNRIQVQRVLYKDSELNDLLDKQLKDLGFYISSYEYCLEV